MLAVKVQKTSPTEAQINATIVQYCAAQSIPLVHIPNEGVRSWKLDATKGIQAGFPDLFIPLVKIPYGGLFLELKRSAKAPVSQNQWSWVERLNRLSYIATIAYGLDEALAFIDDYRKISTNTWKWEKFMDKLHRHPS